VGRVRAIKGLRHFVHEQLFDGRRIRCLTVVDTFSRLSPTIDVRHSYRGADVVATLERATRDIGLPKTIRQDNGPEFVSKELDLVSREELSCF
jgi:putative transposase